ncbi:MAG TPA: helix-turn-helix domain-containing GNAT family N-acetyltransferase [Alphaproteobacteria bacterium]|nr:helix-turn-helix domain-containing GNAT family N-acetyltransferase [Alphaproteobacteria bacterium]
MAAEFDRRVADVRRFNRFYTQKIGVLQQAYLQTPFNLTEARVLYELAHRELPTATELGKDLGLDPGYLSRILRRFEKKGLLTRKASSTDGRQQLLSLTRKGEEAFAPLNTRSRAEISALLGTLAEPEQKRLMEAMHEIESLLSARPEARAPYMLRPHQPGDIGWVIHRHGVLYAQEYGWDETFEALVAEVAAAFIKNFDPKKERCWIAEKDGEIVGSVFLVKKSPAVAKLRLLYVEPKARGLGIGARLTAECERFARQAGYKKIVLWTNSILHAARHIYEKAGFELVASKPHHSFGQDLIGETWEKKL